jgi:hypothetical protein
VFGWLERNPDPAILPELVTALDREGSEFVRPALTRAIAAQIKDPRAQAALGPLVLRGDDFYRGAAIEAIGQYGGTFALKDIAAVAALEGPLQDDAVTAIGRLGDDTYANQLALLQRSGPRELQPTLAAALCLLGKACVETEQYLARTLSFAMAADDQQPLLRSAVHGLAVLAQAGKGDMLKVLLDAGARSTSNASRSPIALGVGVTALRQPRLLLEALETWQDLNGAMGVLRDAFDMLAEDLEEELFCVVVRRLGAEAAAGSKRRAVTDALIGALEF